MAKTYESVRGADIKRKKKTHTIKTFTGTGNKSTLGDSTKMIVEDIRRQRDAKRRMDDFLAWPPKKRTKKKGDSK